MAQHHLCRVGTHEEEDREPKADGTNAGALPEVKAKACPDRLKPLLPPSNFGAVMPGLVYRSSMPEAENFGFLNGLKLKTILTLVSNWKPEYDEWVAEQGIRHVVIPIPANKEVVCIESATILNALAVILDRDNYPLLVHCNKGKHRTGCVIGCLRKIQGEPIVEVVNEYHAYADPKARLLDELFMQDFDERTLLWLARENGHLATDEPGSESPAINTNTPVSRMRN